MNKTTLMIVVVFCSLIIYLAGVYSGLIANRILEEKTNTEIELLKAHTQDELTSLEQYVNFLQIAVQSIQVEKDYINTLPASSRCEALNISLTHTLQRLQTYRDVLPFRIEEYEKQYVLTPEYLELKDQYNTLSLQTWVIARDMAQTCDTRVVDALYFYDKECQYCVDQGEQLDEFTRLLENQGYVVMLFAIDTDAQDSLIRLLKQQYNITQTPALLIENQVFQGKVFSSKELLEEQ